MVPGTSTSSAVDEPIADDTSNTLLNAVVGGVAGIVLSFVPLSTLLGGVLAGYLERGRPADGLKVGAYAGLIMLIPFLFIGAFVLFVLGFGGAPTLFGVAGAFVLLVAAIYTVALGAVGGYLGVVLESELNA